MKKLLEKYLKIYSHESAGFLWIAVIFFVIFFVTAIFRNFVDAAFLKRYGPSYIPMMLVINALLTFVVMAVVDRLGRKFLDHVLLSWILGIYAVSSVILFLMIRESYSIAYPILYQLMYLLDSILLVYLWNIAGDLFDARQGKRIFPLITASQVLGTTVGSFSTGPFTRLAGENSSLIFFGAITLATAIHLFRTGPAMISRYVPKTVIDKTASTVSLLEVPSLMKRYPMIRYLIVTGLVPNVLLPIFFYQFSVIANHTFTSEQSLISFLSLFRGMTTSITFVLLFFMGRMYSSLGVTNSSLGQPINFSILFAGLISSFNIYLACYGQFSTILIQRAIAGPINKILYSIIPSDLVIWSRTFIRGTVLKVGMLIGSLSMIVLKPVLTVPQFSIIALIFAIYWTIETLIFRKHYTRMLKQVIVEKQIDFDQIESIRAFDSGGSAMEVGPLDPQNWQQSEAQAKQRKQIAMDPGTALRLLDDNNAVTRAEAAGSFSLSKDLRSVGKLILLLEDTDDEVRKAAIDALTSFGERILPFLEVSLIEAPPRTKQGILEVIRLANVSDFEIIPFLGKELTGAYSNLIAYRQLDFGTNGGLSAQMLRKHLLELNEETLSLIFYALWVYHADMRLMYQALKSETASIAVELIESSIRKEIAPYLIPLIEDIPIDEKIERGRKLLPLIRNGTQERLLTVLADSEDPLTRMLALFVIGQEKLGESFIPIIEARLADNFPYVQEIARYALQRNRDEVVPMPDIIDKIDKLRTFTIFEGMGLRELHAIASVITTETFAPGEIMIREGEENSSIYLLVSGNVTIFEKYGTPEQREKVSVGEGSFLGELSLFSRMPPNATCVAAQSTSAYVLRHHQFQEIMKIYPQIGINLCRFLSLKLRQVQY
jgi:hypothetical protein